MTSSRKNLTLDLPMRNFRTAPGHPVKYLHHRSCFDLGPHYRNYADWQFEKAKPLYRKNLIGSYGCVNALEFSRDGRLLVSGGDDRRVLLWNIDKAVVSMSDPEVMHAEHVSNVFSLDFSCSSEKIFSAGNDDKVIVHDVATRAPLDYFVHEQPVYGISADPVNDSVFCSACDDGRILIFDIRDSANDPFCLAKATSAFHSVMFHPMEPRLLVTANSKDGVCSWDVRMPKRVFVKYGMQNSSQCCMSARFNRLGSQILVLRRRLPPILYSTDSPSHLYQFNHRGYYNSCTMKSCSFAGINDQYVLSGSDNFDLHLWKIPVPGSDQWVNKAHMVLRGHRSIVNQVRYNYTHNLIASSGVEKIVKLWSPYPLPDEHGGKNPAVAMNVSEERRIYTPDDYVSLVMQTGQGHFMSLTYEAGRKTTREDSRMLAFFDALVQRDINGLSDEESDNDILETSYTNTVYTTPESTSTENEDEDSNPPNFRNLLVETAALAQNVTSRDSNHNDSSAVDAENSSLLSQPSTSNDETNIVHLDASNLSDETANVITPQPNGHSNDTVNQTTANIEDRDITANMITQLILKKESSRRKQLAVQKSTAVAPSNREHTSETESESDQDLNSRLSITSHNSSSRVSNRRDHRRTTTSSYSSSRKEYRKRLLQARRREMLSSSTPVYNSSRNVTDAQPLRCTSQTNYERISELMTRNQALQQQQSDSSINSSSSSSSSSDSSSSDEESRTSDNQTIFKTKGKVTIASKKSRAIISSDSSSSSESDTVPQDCTSTAKTNTTTKEESGSESSSPVSVENIRIELKRKRKPPCKLSASCRMSLKNDDSLQENSSKTSEEEIPYKRWCRQPTESASTSSAEFTNFKHVQFKKFTKQKDRNYRKASQVLGDLSTPPDSGIDVSKEPEPCCSKSFADITREVESKIEHPQETDSNKNNGCSLKPADDLGFGQIDSDEENE